MFIKKITISNLYSFGDEVTHEFKYSSGKTLVIGRNNDDPGMDSNGSGKSSLLNIIYWIIFGEIFQDESVDEIVRRGESKGWGELIIGDDQNEIKIKRVKARKNLLEVIYNNIDKTCDTPSQTQLELLRLLQIDTTAKMKEITTDFINTSYFSTATVKGIMAKETTSKQRFDIVARFLGLKKYDIAANLCKTKRSEIVAEISNDMDLVTAKEAYLITNNRGNVEEAITTGESQIKALSGSIRGLEAIVATEADRENIRQAPINITQQIENTKKYTNDTVKSYKDYHESNERQINLIQVEIQGTKDMRTTVKQLQALVTGNVAEQTKINQEISVLNQSVSNIVNNTASLTNEKNRLLDQMNKHLTCPSCNSALMYTTNGLTKIDTQALQLEIDKISDSIDTNNYKKAAFDASINELQIPLQAIRETEAKFNAQNQLLGQRRAISLCEEDLRKIAVKNEQLKLNAVKIKTEAKATVDKLTQELTVATQRVNNLPPEKSNIQELRLELESKNRELQQTNQQLGRYQQTLVQIGVIEVELKEIQNRIGDKKKEAERVSAWETGFKDIKMRIIEEFLPAFEEKVNDYLEQVQVDMRVDFDTKEAKKRATKKDIIEGRGFKEEFVIKVIKSDSESPFNMLSQGERGRNGSCVGFALRELTREKGTCLFDFLMIDEIADALDETGLSELVNLLDTIHGQKIVISHNDSLKDNFDDIIIVEKNNGVSTIL